MRAFSDKLHALRVLLHYNTLVKYIATVKIEKMPIVHLLLQFKQPTAKLGLVIALILHESDLYWSIHDR